MFLKIIYKFNSKKLKAISKLPKIIIIKLNPKIQFILKITPLNKKQKNNKIIENSIVNTTDSRELVDKVKNSKVIHNNKNKNLDQNNIYVINK